MDARGTKIRELTMEKQAYETECKRLRVMLETVVGGLKMSEVGDIREFAQKQEKFIEDLTHQK